MQMMDAELFDPGNAYTLAEYLDDIQTGLFEELAVDAPEIDPVRRQLQRTYVKTLKDQLAAFDSPMDVSLAAALKIDPGTLKFAVSKGQGTDFRAAARANLSNLRDVITANMSSTVDPGTRAHLEDMQHEIDSILNGEAFKYNSGAGPDLSSLMGQ